MCTSSCTLRYAHTSFADDVLQDASGGVPVEGGLRFAVAETAYGRADLGITGTYQTFDLFSDAALTNVQFTGRLFPWTTGGLHPFVGAGLGLHRLWGTERVGRCGRQTICVSSSSDARQLETGVNPHWTAGVEVFPTARPLGMVVAFTHEFSATAVDWDLNSYRLTAGVVYRPN